MSIFLKTAVNAAKEAGKIVMKNFNKPLEVDYKHGVEIVTNSDKSSEKKIVGILSKKFPSHSFWSEEMGVMKGNSHYKWVIDPLDGTMMYARGLPFFGISIALEKDGIPVSAVVYFPALGWMYCAEKGKGSFMNGARIKVSEKTFKDRIFYLASTDVLRRPEIFDFFKERLAGKRLWLKDFGSCALAMCLVADGRADGCFEYAIKPGDIAAGILLVREAGGVVVNTRGAPAVSDDSCVIALNNNLSGRERLPK
jgi:myo-inositol-1(or 4)-monophosphatase